VDDWQPTSAQGAILVCGWLHCLCTTPAARAATWRDRRRYGTSPGQECVTGLRQRKEGGTMDEPKRFGSYKILEEIGRGNFAIAYRAWDPTLKRDAVLTVLYPQLTADLD